MSQTDMNETFSENFEENENSRNRKKRKKSSKKSPTDKAGVRVAGHAVGLLLPKKKEKQHELINDLNISEEIIPNTETLENKIQTIAKGLANLTGLKNPQQDTPGKIGLDLTNIYQKRVLFAVLQMMSETNYHGDYTISTNQALKETYQEGAHCLEEDVVVKELHLSGPYKNISKVPVISVSLSALVSLAGYDIQSGAEWSRVKEAVYSLATRQYFMMWKRLMYDKKGKPMKDEHGQYKFCYVSEYCPILRVSNIYDDQGQFIKYDISLPAVFLDQVSPEFGGNYFMLIPQGWLTELDQHAKGAKQSPVLATFALYLRRIYQDILKENMRLEKENKPQRNYRIIQKYEDLCLSIGIVKSVFTNQRKRTETRLAKYITILIDTGYLISGDLTLGGEYELILNPDYYPNPYLKEE